MVKSFFQFPARKEEKKKHSSSSLSVPSKPKKLSLPLRAAQYIEIRKSMSRLELRSEFVQIIQGSDDLIGAKKLVCDDEAVRLFVCIYKMIEDKTNNSEIDIINFVNQVYTEFRLPLLNAISFTWNCAKEGYFHYPKNLEAFAIKSNYVQLADLFITLK